MTTCNVPCCTTLKSGGRISLHLFPDPSRDPERHIRWVRAINSEKIFAKDPVVVFKQFRICRAHFDDQSFNGICKKLLKTAIPTLNLEASKKQNHRSKLLIYEKKVTDLLKENSIDINNETFNAMTDLPKSIDPPPTKNNDELSTQDKLWLSGVSDEENDEIYELAELKDNISESNQVPQQFTIVMSKDNPDVIEIDQSAPPQRNVLNFYSAVKRRPPQKVVTESASPSRNPKSLSFESLKKYRNEFNSSTKNQLASVICSKMDPLSAAMSNKFDNKAIDEIFVFTVDLKKSAKATSKQRSWLSAAQMLMQNSFIEQWSVGDFEFSQAYFFYWDKIERSYFFLNNIIETAKRGEAFNGRLVSHLLTDPIGDGGQWDMIVSIINKHGVMPKKCFPESFSCESSARMNAILKSKLREYAKQIRELFAAKASDADIQLKVDAQMKEVYNIVGICLGIPCETFTWEYNDGSVGPVSPRVFYEKYVKPHFNIDDLVCFVNDPRTCVEFGKSYSVECLGNVVGGNSVFYNNQPIDVLIDLVTKSVQGGEPVWCACDLSQKLEETSKGLEIVNFKLLLDTDVGLASKADRLDSGNASMTHALIITGVGLGKNGVPNKFRVESVGNHEPVVMSRAWFEEFVYTISVNKRFVSSQHLRVFDLKPVQLPAWDVMGNLCK